MTAQDVPRSEDATSAPSRVIGQAGEARSARLESVRAVAALAVLASHVLATIYYFDNAQMTDGFVRRLLFGGTYGVYLFFALSGYLLFWPFAKRYFSDGRPIDLGRYALNRALRILPLYYVVIIGVLILQENGGTAQQWELFLTFSENFSTNTLKLVDGVVWTVVVELHFYLLLPVISWALLKLSRGRLSTAGVLLVGAGLASLALRWATAYGTPADAHPILGSSFPAMFMFFAAGMVVALLRLSWERRRPGWLRGPVAGADTWIAVAMGIWLVATLAVPHSGIGGVEAATALAAMLFVGACVLPLQPGLAVRALEWRWLATIGVVSYSIYLLHLPILRAIADSGGSLTHSQALYPVTVAICIPLSFITYHLIEAPFLRLRRRWGSTAAGV
jgi:peptidoglycan/LPS O-acetylase OafA/YrhL